MKEQIIRNVVTNYKDKLLFLRSLCMQVADREYAYQHDYKGGLHNHCGVCAYVVYTLFGGSLLSGVIRNELPNGTRHIWNLLPDGQQIDITQPDLIPLSSKGRILRHTMQNNAQAKAFFRAVALRGAYSVATSLSH